MRILTHSLFPAISEVSAWVAFGLRESLPVPQFNGVYDEKPAV